MCGWGMFAAALTERDSWRRQVDIHLAPASFVGIGLTLDTTAYSDRRPSLSGRGTRHGVGDFTRWRDSRSWDARIGLAIPDTGLSYSGGFAWAEFAYSDAARQKEEDDPLRSPPRWRSGTAYWHRFDTAIWEGEEGAASA